MVGEQGDEHGFPILEPIRFAYAEAFGNVLTFFRAVWFPVLVLIGVLSLIPILIDWVPEVFFFRIEVPTGFGPAGPPVTLAGLVGIAVGTLATVLIVPIYSIWIRMAVFGRDHGARFEWYPFGAGERRLAVLVIGVAVGFQLLVLSLFLTAFALSPELAGPLLLLLGAVFLGAYYLGVRLLPVLAGLLCDPTASFGSLWRMARGRLARMFASATLFSLSLLILVQVFSVLLGGMVPVLTEVFVGNTDLHGPGGELVLVGIGIFVSVAVALVTLTGCCFSARVYTQLR